MKIGFFFCGKHEKLYLFAALQYSMQDGAKDQSEDMGKLLADQSFVSSILTSVRLFLLLFIT